MPTTRRFNTTNMPAPKPGDTELLKEIRETYTRYVQAWKDVREQGRLDMQALSIDGPWDPIERANRANKDNPRPCVHLDIIRQNNNRVKGQARLNKRGIKVTPKGDGESQVNSSDPNAPKGENPNEKKAQLRQGRIRQIEYESRAVLARLAAFDSAVDRGYGFYRVRTDWADRESTNTKIIIERIPNPDSVLVDPDCKEADYSDMKRAFVVDRMSKDDFKAKYPGFEIKSFSAKELETYKDWIDTNSLQLADYYRVEEGPKQRKLVIEDGTPAKLTLTEDELFERFPDAKLSDDTVTPMPGGQPLKILRERDIRECKVMKYHTNGFDILDREELECSTIPIITITGPEEWVDGKRVLISLTRFQRQPQMLFDYAKSNQQEVLGMTPKSKWVVVDGQLEGFEDEWANANKSPTAYLRYKAKIDATGEQVLSAPQRVDFEPPVQALEMAADSALRAAQNASGRPSTDQKDRAAKSGIAQDKMDQAADINSKQFSDAMDIAVAYEARIVNELLDKVEDSERDVSIRKEDDSSEMVHIAPKQDEQGNVVDHDYGDSGQFHVFVGAGPSLESQREAAQETANLLLQNPESYTRIAWLAIKMLNLGPYGDQMSDLLKPPDVKAKENGGQPDSQQLQQQLQQVTQALKMTTEQLNQEKQASASKQQDLDAKVKMNDDNNVVKLAVAEIQTAAKVSGDQLTAFMTKMDQTLQMLMQERDHMHQMSQQDSQQQHATDQQTQQIGAQQDQSAQQADLQREQMQQSQERM